MRPFHRPDSSERVGYGRKGNPYLHVAPTRHGTALGHCCDPTAQRYGFCLSMFVQEFGHVPGVARRRL